MVSIDELLQVAYENGASDVHITVGVPPKYRVNGALLDMNYPRLMGEDTEVMIKSIMKPHQLEQLKENGETDFSYSIANMARFRVNAFNQRGSLAAALRLVGTEIPKSEALGIPKSVIDLHKKKRGLVLVTGPTGSGKSTSLASLIDRINDNFQSHIITLEDPIEYLHRHKKSMVNQREIGTDSNSYANALRAALREDPDVILVGEMRDLETISTAITAAETGHLVFSTLHTIGAASTIDRIIDVFPPHQQQQIKVQLATVLEAVISQQLMPNKENNGRVAAFEVMLANPAVRNLIREGKSHQLSTVMQTNRKMGMITMDDGLQRLVMENKISVDTAIQFAIDSDSMAMKLGRKTEM